jgi:glycolate oxidase
MENKKMNDGINNPPPKSAEIKTAQISAASNDFQNLHELVAKARANLNQNAWDYIVGGTETETTLRRNRMALDEIAFRPRVLHDVSKVDASVQVMGRKLRLPVMLAPVGALESFDPGAGGAVVRAADAFGAAHMLSSVSEPGLEKVAEAAPGALRIYQLYVRGDDAFVEDRIDRAIANGYAAFCLTVDTAHYSRRERDLAKRYVRANRRDVSGREFQMALDWRTVKRIKDKYKIPLVIKGIATAEDAAIACDHGVEWIYVSNHGGRQLDHGRGAMHILPEVAAAVAGRAGIMVDGSFCRGTDIVKAIAAGAALVGLGRLQCWALAAAGEAGVVRMLELLEDEVQRCLGLLGVNSFAELDTSYLHSATATNPADVFSAFPLLQIEPYRY